MRKREELVFLRAKKTFFLLETLAEQAMRINSRNLKIREGQGKCLE
jgi:hypothetical protein